MPALRTNILANYAGQAWTAIMGIAFVPAYVHLMGIEAFGLVGFLLSIQAISQLMDFGIGGVVNRELARRAHSGEASQDVHDLVRTLEVIVWPTALVVGIGLGAVSTTLATHWLHPHTLSIGDTAHAVVIMAAVVATFWPTNFYTGALMGLERQSTLNLVNAAFATLRWAGVMPILLFVSPTIEAYLWWQVLVGVAQSASLAFALRRAMPFHSGRASIQWIELKKVRRFAGGMFLISALSLCVSQFDRLALSRLRPLEEFGYYAIVVSMAAGLARLIQPMFNAIYPRFTRLVAAQRIAEVSELYHVCTQLLVVVLAAATATLIVFRNDIVYLWTGDVVLVNLVSTPIALYLAGTAVNGLMNVPYAMQLAYGWTRLPTMANAVALTLVIPYGIWAVRQYGMAGAASIWLLVNVGNFAFTVPLMHRRVLPGEAWRWYLGDILPACASALFAAIVLRQLIESLPRDIYGIATLCGISVTVLAAAGLASSEFRALMYQQTRRAFRR